ncbi:MAG: hypothetical protein LBK82_05765, partial [Planctomycetaceae bacterium]|nr:hypothetical protein [Planctomycetaceae bacterium]
DTGLSGFHGRRRFKPAHKTTLPTKKMLAKLCKKCVDTFGRRPAVMKMKPYRAIPLNSHEN